MKVSLQKIRITGLRQHYKILMQELHRRGVLQVSKNEEFAAGSTAKEVPDHFDVFDLARIEATIKALSPFVPPKGKMESMLTGGKVILSEEEAKKRFITFSPKADEVISTCEKSQELAVRLKNEIVQLQLRKAEITSFLQYRLFVDEHLETDQTVSVLGKLQATKKDQFVEALATKSPLLDIEVFGDEGRFMYMRLTFAKEIQKEVLQVFQDFGFVETNLAVDFSKFPGKTPKEILSHYEERIEELQKSIDASTKMMKGLAAHVEDLQILFDFHSWRKTKNDARKNVLETKNIFAFEGWVPVSDFKKLDHWMQQIFVGEVSMDKIEPTDKERVPVLLRNKKGIASFDFMTEMFGSPGRTDIDPTPMMAPFFVVFFGICLSDTGYGLILTLASSFFMLFGNFSAEARTSLRMILMCGISAFFGGVLLGGHFGLTPDQAPSFLTTLIDGERVFRGQVLDPLKGQGPMIFLGFSFAVGYIQILGALIMKFIRGLQNNDYGEAFCDGLGWFYTLVMLIVWIFADKIGLEKQIALYALLAGVGFLVLTLGREHKNILKRIIFGILGLYGAMDYVSKILSYSRLMALGLATGIIGAAMNMTAELLGGLIPGVLGTIVLIAFALFGHSLNFALSGLGAFVHSMRLQFIEFFGIFYTAGGTKFEPFARVNRYLFLRS